jgi:hypothetical protein
MITLNKYNTALTPDDLFRHVLDQYGASYPDALAAASASEKLSNAMLDLIKRKGHMDELMVDLGLCNLCQSRQRQRRAAR